jgi:hypothetical protein
MRLTIEMPPINSCAATGCAYNQDRKCHARAITVGSGIHPACDTFIPSASHVPDHGAQAGVGACKIESCRHNHELECQAAAISVSVHAQHADCATFEQR